jgi:hypothetical protein
MRFQVRWRRGRGKAAFLAFGCLIKRSVFVHRDHEVFIEGIEQEKRLELTFFSRKQRREVVSPCAPLHYSKSPAGTTKGVEYELECYYLWNFGAEKGNNFLALSPSEIVSMELTDDVFHVQEFYSHSNLVRNTTKDQDINE